MDYSLLNNNEKNFTKIFTNFDLKQSMEEILELTRDKFEMKGLNVSLDLQKFNGHSLVINTDQKRLQQVLLNLVTNAVKFTDRGGNIQIKASLENGMDQRMLKVAVKDNGVGIKEEHQAKIFQMFSTFKDQKKNLNVNGIGLGLSICKLIVEKFKGAISFESKPGEGTTFFFTFEVGDAS